MFLRDYCIRCGKKIYFVRKRKRDTLICLECKESNLLKKNREIKSKQEFEKWIDIHKRKEA